MHQGAFKFNVQSCETLNLYRFTFSINTEPLYGLVNEIWVFSLTTLIRVHSQ